MSKQGGSTFPFHGQTMTMFHGPTCDAAAHPATQQFFGGSCAATKDITLLTEAIREAPSQLD